MFFLGIDLGTSYFKAALFNEQGRLCGLGRQLLEKKVAEQSCELPVALFWQTLHTCVAQAMQEAGARPQDIRALSYSSQANSFLLLDKTNEPLTPIILWPDTRALPAFDTNDAWHQHTGMGMPLTAHSAVNKLAWIRQQHPLLWQQVATVCTISDYVTLALTGEKAADGSTASLLGLLDVQACAWWDEAMRLAQLPHDLFCRVFYMGTPIGKICRAGAARLGLSEQTHYSLGGLDHHMAALGAGLYDTDKTSESTGTVLAAVQSTRQYQPQQNVWVAPGMQANHFFRMSFDDNGARPLELYQKNKAPEYSIEELLHMAAIAHTEHGIAVRQLLISTAISLRTLVQRLNSHGPIVSTGGGARSTLWVKIKAELLNRPFIIPACSEAACLGAAMMAAKGLGHLHNLNDWVHIHKIIEPQIAS
jgi:Sugar (pentulose and hexulose) kinases